MDHLLSCGCLPVGFQCQRRILNGPSVRRAAEARPKVISKFIVRTCNVAGKGNLVAGIETSAGFPQSKKRNAISENDLLAIWNARPLSSLSGSPLRRYWTPMPRAFPSCQAPLRIRTKKPIHTGHFRSAAALQDVSGRVSLGGMRAPCCLTASRRRLRGNGTETPSPSACR